MRVKVSPGAEEGGEDPRYMTSLARGLGVLRAFEGRPSLTTTQAAAATGLSRSSAARCLYTLERLGYVAAEGSTYRLQAALLPLVRAYTYSDPLAMAAQPVVASLRERLGESSSLAVFEPTSHYASVIYVCRAETSHIISIPLLIGSTLPSYCTSMGRVLLAALPEDKLTLALGEAELRARTPATITAPLALKEEILRVRQQGYAIVDEELERGLRSIAVPVRTHEGKVTAALNVGAPTPRRSMEWLRDTARSELQAAAAHLTRVL
jgi:IclR family pca regulon transcriptional regulator